jgi:CelD/BcsL family acetyltransferase involved in cellulose biosynthesis
MLSAASTQQHAIELAPSTTFQIVRNVGDLAAVAHAWRALAQASGQACTFVRPEWMLPWLRRFGQAASLFAVLAWRGSRLVGVFPFEERSLAPLPVPGGRSLVYLGNEHSPEADFLVDARWRNEILSDFLDWCSRSRVGGLFVERLCADSPNYAPLSALLREKKFYVTESSYWTAHITDVEGDFDTFLSRQSKNFRKQLKKALRAGDAFGQRIDLVTSTEELDAVMPELSRVSAASWQGKAGTGTFSSASDAAFYRDVAASCAASGRLRLFVCRAKGRVVGFVLCIAGARELEALKSEFDEELGEMMTGWLIYRALYDHAARSGLSTINSGTWKTDFKERWSTYRVDQLSVQIFPPTVGGSLRFLPRLSKEIIKRAMDKPNVARVYPLFDEEPPNRRSSRPPPP